MQLKGNIDTLKNESSDIKIAFFNLEAEMKHANQQLGSLKEEMLKLQGSIEKKSEQIEQNFKILENEIKTLLTQQMAKSKDFNKETESIPSVFFFNSP